jgi:uncharacterized protein YyaL (SSP411 family)
MQTNRVPNKLIQEKSPYLLQHAYNPVAWYPWGEEAFARARAEDKPIFLSIGYSTCHWCHVMERESFENDAIANLLNQYFVAIKVDREERPDIDKIYMSALQAMGQDGGWPMSMFLTPDRKPFWGGTYFPPDARYGKSGFADILRRIHTIWSDERSKVTDSADKLTSYLSDLSKVGSIMERAAPATRDTCFSQIEQTFDEEMAGFGRGAKFPRPAVFHFLLRHYARTGNPRALEMVERTLQAMAAGGIYDHIGGGFHRYAVDREWRIPHFEKMLCDQAQIVGAYVELFQIAKAPLYSRIIRETCDYVLRDLTHPEGGFYSAEDADSPKPEDPHESGEGAFYVWSKAEVERVLGPGAELFLFAYGIEEEGNAPFDPQREFKGKNIFYLPHPYKIVADRFNLGTEELAARLLVSRRKLFEERNKRPRPHLDDKVITSWNGLMIGALARAGIALGEDRYVVAARRAAGFVISQAYNPWSRTLLRRYRDGDARHAANLDDYVFLMNGLVDLYETTGEIGWLRAALRMTDDVLEAFWDNERGGFFDTSGKDPTILVRLKEQYDGAEPAGNSVAATVLLRLSEMTGNSEWRRKAEHLLDTFSPALEQRPVAMPYMVSALDCSLRKPIQVVIAGEIGREDVRRLAQELGSRFLPNKIVLYADGGAGQQELAEMQPFMKDMGLIQGRAAAYVCRDFVCRLPTTVPGEFSQSLEAEERR